MMVAFGKSGEAHFSLWVAVAQLDGIDERCVQRRRRRALRHRRRFRQRPPIDHSAVVGVVCFVLDVSSSFRNDVDDGRNSRVTLCIFFLVNQIEKKRQRKIEFWNSSYNCSGANTLKRRDAFSATLHGVCSGRPSLGTQG